MFMLFCARNKVAARSTRPVFWTSDTALATTQGVLTLFELATLDNWGDALFAAMDITGLDKQPRRNAEWQNAIFFVVFICVSAHFMIKSFVGVFCEQVLFRHPRCGPEKQHGSL